MSCIKIICSERRENKREKKEEEEKKREIGTSREWIIGCKIPAPACIINFKISLLFDKHAANRGAKSQLHCLLTSAPC